MKHTKIVMIMLLYLLLLAQPSFSIIAKIDDPANIGEMKVKIIQHGKIIVSGGKLEWAKINLTIPQDNSNQQVITDEKYVEDELKNNILTITKNDPLNIIDYSAESIVTINERTTLNIPETYMIPDDVKIYLKPTPNIQSNNTEIIKLAKDLTKDSKTDFERIAKLAEWVNANVEYKISQGTEAKDAVWTLKNKVGTCDEFSSLFIALARAAGYPARYISGYAYGKDGWEKHAFADVYLGRWIPVDPTWNEVGNLDATHIQFTTKADNIIKNEIQVYGTKIGDMTWTEDETDITILEVKEKEKVNDYELKRSSDTLEMGEEAIVMLRFMPEEYKVIELHLEPCLSAVPIVETEKKEKIAILEPGKEKIVYWKIKVSDSLKRNAEYTCPMTLNSRLLAIKAIDLTINTLTSAKPDDIKLDANLDKTEFMLREKGTIHINIEKIQGSKDITIGIISGSSFVEKTLTLSPEETSQMTYTFTSEELGEQDIIIYSSTGKVQILKYRVIETGDLYIDSIDMPEYAKSNQEIPITVTIKNNRLSPETIRLTTVLDGKEEIISEKIEYEKQIKTSISSSDVGDKTVSFNLAGPGIDQKATRNIRIYDKPEIEITTRYDYDKNIATLDIETKKDIAKEIVIEVNGISKKIDSPGKKTHLEFSLPVGTYDATIKYIDLGGERFVKSTTIEIKEMGILEKIMAFIKEIIGTVAGLF